MSGSGSGNGESFTGYGWFVCLWVLIAPFQYGYHISALNQIKAVLTCEDTGGTLPGTDSAPTCIPMSNFVFSFVTSIFTVGGLLGSLGAQYTMDRYGRKGAAKITAVLLVAGAALMSVSGSVTTLSTGRFLTGVGSGIGICLSPVYIAEIAPTKIGGGIGVLTQLGIVIGILVTQLVGFHYSTPTEWRLVLFISAMIGVLQFIASYLIVESPTWLGNNNRPEEKKAAAKRLWGVQTAHTSPSAGSDEDPLLDQLEARRPETHSRTVDVAELFFSPELRKPLMIVCFAMFAQQVSGINAVLYYSNDILSKSLPDLGPYVSLGIAFVNMLMTFPPIILVERMGRRPLLAWSSAGALVSLVAVGYGLNSGFSTLASIATLAFVMSFAVGLGPIPLVLIPETSPSYAVSALSSMALSLNWVVNFLVGLVFLPLRSLLSGDDPAKEGRVFYVFAIVMLGATISLFKVYRA